MAKASSYRASGVDVNAADRLLQFIRKTHPDIGGFSGLFPITLGAETAYLVGTTDGVGTKLKLAFMLDRHDTIGIDLVAMCVNDLITTGASPLFFLDYYATGKINLARSRKILQGIMRGCELGKLKLLGGETAEMPGFYQGGEYDLAGFAVGLVREGERLDRRKASAGDVVVAWPSSGVHSNGFSLIRRALGLAELRRMAPQLLTPTRIYVDDVRLAQRAAGPGLKALAHITGEGLAGNVPRVLPGRVRVVISRRKWAHPEVFERIQRLGRVSEKEMWATFNMGLGMVGVVSENALGRLRSVCKDLLVVGHVERGSTPFILAD